MRRKGFDRLLLAGGLLCIAAALFFVSGNLLENARAQRSAQTAVSQLKPESSAPAKNEGQAEEAVPQPQPFLDPDSGLMVVEVDGRYYMGYLSLPALGLELPVQSTWTYPQLKISPCRYVGVPEQSGFVVMAHNYDAHFGRLGTLQEGDAVYFTDVTGTIYPYTVARVETLLPTAIEQMKSSEWDMTLFTCTVGGKARVTVRCTRRDAP